MPRYAAIVLTLAVPIPAAAAQERILDAGTLLVTHGGLAAGREEFTVRRGGAGAITITVRSYYPPNRGEPVLAPLVELRPDSQLASAQFAEPGASGRHIILQAAPRRVTVRIISQTGESVRQYPAAEPVVVADDSALSLHAVAPGTAPAIGLVWPRGPRRLVTPLRDQGMEETDWHGETRRLRHFVLGSGSDSRHLWYDGEGRLMKVEMPATGVVGIRAPARPSP